MDTIELILNENFPMTSDSEVGKNIELSIRKAIFGKAYLSRKVEEKLLELYAENKLFGTVHTCIGQEFSGAVITEFLKQGDSIFSNHRCHGHFLSFTNDVDGLIAEVMGKKNGVCGGLGGSQHLCKDGFFSNGIQGGGVPVALGLAMAKKFQKKENISTVFIGDGTLGEGTVYESLNIASLWSLPLLIVLENNKYSQSTPQHENLAGDICSRASAFDIRAEKADTWNWEELYSVSKELVNYVRKEKKPAFLQIDTYRLKAHSKGDDNRPRSEVEVYEKYDPINIILDNHAGVYTSVMDEIHKRISDGVAAGDSAPYPELKDIPRIQNEKNKQINWQEVNLSSEKIVKVLNDTFKEILSEQPRALFIGEDVKAPYGGAYKVSQELSDLFPEQVFNTPISEAALIGLGCGLAVDGFRPFIEVMFGDFITLAFDQLLNHASKFKQMFNNQVDVNLVVRTPMGGGRGYGPSHSQTLDKHFMGIPGLQLLALSNLVDPKNMYKTLSKGQEGVTLVIENKLMYAQKLRATAPKGFKLLNSSEKFPTALLMPESTHIDCTLIGYGGVGELMIKAAETLFIEHDIIIQVICPTKIYPFDFSAFIPLVNNAEHFVVVEEGQGFAGFGAEIIAQLAELMAGKQRSVKRIYPPEVCIPASGPLEKYILPSVESIINSIIAIINNEDNQLTSKIKYQ